MGVAKPINVCIVVISSCLCKSFKLDLELYTISVLVVSMHLFKPCSLATLNALLSFTHWCIFNSFKSVPIPCYVKIMEE